MGKPYSEYGLVAEKGKDKFGSFHELAEHLKKVFWEGERGGRIFDDIYNGGGVSKKKGRGRDSAKGDKRSKGMGKSGDETGVETWMSWAEPSEGIAKPCIQYYKAFYISSENNYISVPVIDCGEGLIIPDWLLKLLKEGKAREGG